VVSISLSPNHDLKFSDLQIDKKKLTKSKDGELPGIVYYTNDAPKKYAHLYCGEPADKKLKRFAKRGPSQ
jgi:hypothetical protein